MRRALFILLLCVSVSGCAAVVVGTGAAGAYLWVRGWMETTFDTPLPQVEKAVRKAMEDLEFVAVDAKVDRLEGEVTARMASGAKVHVKLKAVDFEHTRVRVRVGTLGDRGLSEQVMRYIEKNL